MRILLLSFLPLSLVACKPPAKEQAVEVLESEEIGEPDLTFVDLPDLVPGRSLASSASDGEALYACNGMTTTVGHSSVITRYDLSEGKWTVTPAALIPRVYSSAEVVGGMLYVFNGVAQSVGEKDRRLYLFPSVEKVDLKTMEKYQTIPNPHPARSSGSAVWKDTIYVVGGSAYSGNYSNRLMSFSPSTGEWAELKSMPEAKECTAEIIDGKLFVIGGYHGKASRRVDYYDIAADRWTRLDDLKEPLSAQATTVIGDQIWMVGDFSRQTLVACFDTGDETYREIPSNLKPRRHANAEVVDSTLYVFGGNTESSSASSQTSTQAADLSGFVD